MKQQRWILLFIFGLLVAAIIITKTLGLQLGLDLRGGAQLTIEVQPTKEITTITGEDLNGVKTVIENRINALGVSESLVQTVGGNKILVQLPGVTDPQQAERILGGTAQLEFREQRKGTEGQFQAVYRITKALEAELEAAKKEGNNAAAKQKIAELTQSIQRNNQDILKLFDSVDLTGKTLKMLGLLPLAPAINGKWPSASIKMEEKSLLN